MTTDRVHEVRLDNGLRALLLPRDGLPVVACSIWYTVGSRDERTGETGVSHFLEHMMFKGTQRLAKGEIDLITTKVGGANNAFTDNDVTAYYFSLPAERWQTALEIEAERMRGCLLDPDEFAAEKSVVLEELAMGEDDPWRLAFQAAEALLFQVHPYHHPVIGWRDDLVRLPVDVMRGYYRRHYAPDRALLVVAGDIDVAAAEARIRELFGPLPPAGDARAPALPEPEQCGERRAVLRFPGNLSRLVIAVRTCRMGEDDDFILDVASHVLAGGKTSRLYRRLVKGDKLAVDVNTYNEPRLDPGVFWLQVELRPQADSARVERAVREEIAELAARGPTAAELRRARVQLDAGHRFEQETALDVALKIGRCETCAVGGRAILADLPARYAAVGAREVRDCVRRYFAADRWNVVWSLPPQPELKRRRAATGKKAATGTKAAKGKGKGKGRGKKAARGSFGDAGR